MRDENDWRLTNQLDYLRGATLSWRRYRAPRPEWDHDHCQFCFAKFGEPSAGELAEGYTTPDEYRWICAPCFEDFRDLFEWSVGER